MTENIVIVKVDSDYCDYLRKFDKKVAYNKDEKSLRPFVGILFTVNDMEYYAPLSSPKKKFLTMRDDKVDFIKIEGGKFGAVNFNNMIPVCKNNYELIDLDDSNTITNHEWKYKQLLKYQLTWLNKNVNQIRGKSSVLYSSYTNNKLPNYVKDRCCNFSLLEEKCKIYNRKNK